MFFSEYGQDEFVAQLCPKLNGTFVEFGALDGILHSNSLYLERTRGWNGLLIEANPEAFQSLIANRPKPFLLNTAIYDKAGTVEFEKIDGSYFGWSGITEAIEPEHRNRMVAQEIRTSTMSIPAITLDDALSYFGITHIDYLSIDTEGSELAILKVFPFSKFSIDILGVEDNFGNAALDDLIQRNGFRFLRKCGPDRMYRHESNLSSS